GIRFRVCDPTLYDRFRNHLRGSDGHRSIALLESLGVLPVTTRFHSEIVLSGEARSTWFAGAMAVAGDVSAIFCDPDNGIAKPGSDNERTGSVKHILLSEIETLHTRGCGLVVYHHLSREVGGH